MARICYTEHKFSEKSLIIIAQANKILEEYGEQGFDLTLRQLYYQFVSRDIIANSMREYKNLGSIINDARLAGLIDWDHIVDRTRNLRGNNHWNSPNEIIETCARQFMIDKWADQPVRMEVWIEKDALIGVIERICRRLDIPHFSCRGYVSQSEIHEACKDRLIAYEENGQETIVIHLGDHDPSGIDMSRDIEDRFRIFGAKTEVRRIALNMNQVRQYNPPPNPAKLTDSRVEGYIAAFGSESWELDALEPKVIGALIEKEIKRERDDDKWDAATEREAVMQEQLQKCADHWDPKVVDFLAPLKIKGKGKP